MYLQRSFRIKAGLVNLKGLWLVLMKRAMIFTITCKLASTPNHEKHPGISIAYSDALITLLAINREHIEKSRNDKADSKKSKYQF